MDLAHADPLSNDEVAVDGHVAELRAGSTHDHRTIHLTGRALTLAHKLAERTVKNGDRLSAGDGFRGAEQAVCALNEALCSHQSNRVSRPRGDLRAVGELRHGAAALKTEGTAEQHSGLLSGDGVGGVYATAAAEHYAHSVGLEHRVGVERVPEIGEAVRCRRLIAHQTVEDDGHFTACDLVVREELAVVAFNQTKSAEAFDGLCCPVTIRVAVDRLCRARAYREQTDCHGKREEEG